MIKVNTHPLNHAKKAVHVKTTWGKYGQLMIVVVVVTNADNTDTLLICPTPRICYSSCYSSKQKKTEDKVKQDQRAKSRRLQPGGPPKPLVSQTIAACTVSQGRSQPIITPIRDFFA